MASKDHPKIKKFIGSKLFFRLTLVLFVLQSTWVAISARYPMAFDESFHLGIIKLYAKQWSPFFSVQPPGPATYSTLTRDPSYIFHWLMSFPWRIMTHLTDSFMWQVITLRLIDIIFVAIGLWLCRKLLLRTTASPVVVNTTLLFFVLIPIVPLLSGQINYDDLLLPLTAWTLLMTIDFVRKLKDHDRFDLTKLVGVISMALITSLVKFTFLPILAAIAAYLLFEFYRYSRVHRHKLKKLAVASWSAADNPRRIRHIIILAVSVALFLYTYGVNIVVYKNPIPQCNQVLTVARCSTYPPWARNYNAAQQQHHVDPNPITFLGAWIYGMFDRLFFVINSSGPPHSNDNHLAPVVAITAAIFGLFAIYLLIRYSNKIIKSDWVLGFLLFVAWAYCLALFGRNYHDYLQLGRIVAINGRYLLQIILPVYLLVLMCYREFFKTHLFFRDAFLIMIFILFLEGGGITSYLYYSNSAWYWPNDRFVNSLSQDMHKVVDPVFVTTDDIPYFIRAKDTVLGWFGQK